MEDFRPQSSASGHRGFQNGGLGGLGIIESGGGCWTGRGLVLSSVGTGTSMVGLGPGRAVYSGNSYFCSFPVIEGGLYR